MQKQQPIVITANVHGEVVEIEASETVTEVSGDLRKCRVVKGNALPLALREAPNVVGKLTAAQVEAIKRAQARKAHKRKG
jgi:hypothetical protein